MPKPGVALLLRLLLQLLPELHALLRRHARVRLLGRGLVLLRREVRRHLLVALRHLLVGVPLLRRALLVAVGEVLVVLLLSRVAQ